VAAQFSVIETLEGRLLLSGTNQSQNNGHVPGALPASTLTALDAYVHAADSSYAFSLNSTITSSGYTDYVVNMTSQTWRTSSDVNKPVWTHWLQIIVPDTVKSKTAILNINGGSNTASAPTAADSISVQAALATGSIVVFLPDVPSEPLTFTDETTPRTEDQIIAYTFNKFLNGGDQNWPLLLPMVKSAVRAMDTAQSFVAAQSGGAQSINDFIVSGASKRGWTTWLTPAVDSRVKAIVPFVFDILNQGPQIPHHKDTYVGVTTDVVGGYSSAIQDYTNLNIFDRINTPQGIALQQIVDPYVYLNRSSYNIPKYMIDSTGDQFFVPDSAQYYIGNLPGYDYIRYVPNTDHSLNSDAVTGAINFEKALLDGAALPQYNWNVTDGGSTIDVTPIDVPVAVKMWQATNTANRDFRLETFGAHWTSTPLTAQPNGDYVAHVTPPASGATAFMIELDYVVDGVNLTFTTQVSEVPKFTPTLVAADPGGTYNGTPFTATATATGVSGSAVAGNFSFAYYAGSTVGGQGSTTAPTSAGTYTVVASFTSGDSSYVDAQSSPVTFTIGPAKPTVVATDNGGTFNGKPFAATATATGVGGGAIAGNLAFSYYVGSSVNGTGSSIAPISVGTYTVVASFTSADSNYSNAQSNPATFTISPLTPLVGFAGSYSGTYSGDESGTSTFIVDTNGNVTVLTPAPGTGTVSPSGALNVTLTYPTYTVFASGNLVLSSIGVVTGSGTWSYTLNGVTESGTWNTARIVSATVTVSDAGGTFNGNPFPAVGTAWQVDGQTPIKGSFAYTYYAGTTVSGAGSSTPPANAGTYTVVASFTSGDPNYNSVQSAPFTFAISPAAPAITASDAGGTYNGEPFVATPTATGVGGAAVSGGFAFTYYVGPTASGSGSSSPPADAGTYTVIASFTSTDPNYASGQSAAVTFSIAPAGTSTAFVTSANPSIPFESVTFTATVTSAAMTPPIGSVTFMDGSNPLTTVSIVNGQAAFSIDTLALGTHTIAAVYNGSTDFVSSTSTAVSQAVQTVAYGPDPIQAGQTAIDIGGTPGDDIITIGATTKKGFIQVDVLETGPVSYHFSGTFSISTVDRIFVLGGSGNDSIRVGGISLPVIMYGGDGNDTLTLTGTLGAGSSFDGGNGANTIVGRNATTTWNITGSNAGNVGGVSFTNVQNLTGGTGADTFVFASGGSLSGVVQGGSGTNTVTGPNSSNVWIVSALNAGSLNGNTFAGIQNLKGGTAGDIFEFADTAAIAGTINGGNGKGNWLDYGAYTTDVTVNLSTGAASHTGGVTNIQNVRGGSGNDTITGNSQGNILLGGAGNDTIQGGSARSLLIGDTGADHLTGGSNPDIIISGYTDYDANFAALQSILAEWQSANSYATRISHIKNGGGLNGSSTLAAGTTVHDDSAADTLTGAGGVDWFFANASDLITDLASGEQVN
jgi:PhoPQ-activated pathogenicity-related protein